MDVERAFGFLNDPENWPKWADGDGSTFLMTFFQPPVLDDRAFDDAANEVGTELAKLKELLAARSDSRPTARKSFGIAWNITTDYRSL